MGYLHNDLETKAAVADDFWLKQSGDLGYTDDDGFVVVLGKKENFITLTSGEVISPHKVIPESSFRAQKIFSKN